MNLFSSKNFMSPVRGRAPALRRVERESQREGMTTSSAPELKGQSAASAAQTKLFPRVISQLMAKRDEIFCAFRPQNHTLAAGKNATSRLIYECRRAVNEEFFLNQMSNALVNSSFIVCSHRLARQFDIIR